MKLPLNTSNLYDKAVLYSQLVRLDKPVGILLLLWPTLIALWIAAEGWPDPLVLFVFVLGVTLMRSAGCAINDYADRHIDGKVERTKDRPLASGKISETETLIIFASLSLIAFVLVLFMNTLTILMSLGGILLAVSYPFMKRYHYLPQVHLGAAFGWSAPMAYTAQANEITAVTWLLFLATILWATAYDTMYAMVDYDDDIKIGVKSTAVLFGNQDKLIIGIIQVLLIFNLILIGQRAELGYFYYLGVAAAALFSGYQQRELCFKAFLNNNWLGFVLFVSVMLDFQYSTP
jgi:4-hydroxybenzoate polyprenyltransferase